MGAVERGERNVSLANILRISAALGVRPSELFIRFERLGG
jgi:transcriptional regulator with XRE-family HTH domain